MTPRELDAYFYRAPDDLRARVLSDIRRDDPARRERSSLVTRLSSIAVGLAWAASLVLISRFSSMESGGSRLVQEIVSSHVRSMMPGHLMDVASTDRHTVKPWFGGKLDFSPQVEDLAADGFPLVGGRLDYVSSRPVAALVYRHEQHVINLVTWPSPESAPHTPRLIAQQGYQIFEWSRGGMQYWLISDLNAAELQKLAERIQ
jgi:anti-sigma factor RsiW